MYMNPARMSRDHQRRIVRWMVANGCTDYVALEPIVLKGKVLHYTSCGRRGRRVAVRNGEVVTRRRQLRIRITLRKVRE
ncbi:MAG: hypothetical protein FWH11_01365 [Micrococcales bacterium]|nr:hypothetical protein [Micrococcales bacterium]